MYSATVTSTGQITLPKPVRDFLKVSAGNRVVFELDKGGARIERAKTFEEITDEIHSFISDSTREKGKKYAGMTATEFRNAWAENPEGKKYFAEKYGGGNYDG